MKVLKVFIAAEVPVHENDAMEQARVTLALNDAVQSVLTVARTRGGWGDAITRIVSVRRQAEITGAVEQPTVVIPRGLPVGTEITVKNHSAGPVTVAVDPAETLELPPAHDITATLLSPPQRMVPRPPPASDGAAVDGAAAAEDDDLLPAQFRR